MYLSTGASPASPASPAPEAVVVVVVVAVITRRLVLGENSKNKDPNKTFDLVVQDFERSTADTTYWMFCLPFNNKGGGDGYEGEGLGLYDLPTSIRFFSRFSSRFFFARQRQNGTPR